MSAVGRVVPVVRREFLERVRSKAFLIATIAGPLLMSAMLVGPALLAGRQRGKPLRVAVVDASGQLRTAVEDALRAESVDGRPRFAVQVAAAASADAEPMLKADIVANRIDGYLKLPADVLDTSAADYYGRNVTNFDDLRLLDRTVEQALVALRLERAGLDPARVKGATRSLELRRVRVSERGEREEGAAGVLFPVILMMMLYTTILMWGQAVMTSVIEEKTSRVMEVMLSSVPAQTLFAGKLLGTGAAGLVQFLVWSLAMLAVSVFGAGMTGAMRLPEITPLLAVSFVVFFLLGYFIYAALYAAIGASVNTVQEAQNLAFPVMAPLILGTVFFPMVLRAPESGLSVALSLVPLLSPILMFLRIAVLTPPLWQILLSIVLTAATIVVVLWLAARIYRVGVLMYGKRPTFPEIVRWVRQP